MLCPSTNTTGAALLALLLTQEWERTLELISIITLCFSSRKTRELIITYWQSTCMETAKIEMRHLLSSVAMMNLQLTQLLTKENQKCLQQQQTKLGPSLKICSCLIQKQLLALIQFTSIQAFHLSTFLNQFLLKLKQYLNLTLKNLSVTNP